MPWRFEGKFATSEAWDVPPVPSFGFIFPAAGRPGLHEDIVDILLMHATGF